VAIFSILFNSLVSFLTVRTFHNFPSSLARENCLHEFYTDRFCGLIDERNHLRPNQIFFLTMRACTYKCLLQKVLAYKNMGNKFVYIQSMIPELYRKSYNSVKPCCNDSGTRTQRSSVEDESKILKVIKTLIIFKNFKV
jgi:hypothetical protein